MKKKYFVRKTLSIILVTCLLPMIGCGHWHSDSQIASPDATVMPSIVMVDMLHRMEAPKQTDDVGRYVYIFWDKDGNRYSMNASSYVDIDALIDMLDSADPQLEMCGNDFAESDMVACHKQICKLATDDGLRLQYPDAMPAVEADIKYWYGIYYDTEQKLHTLEIHRVERMCNIATNRDAANELYERFNSLFN